MYTLGYLKDAFAFMLFIFLAYLLKTRQISYNYLFILCIGAAIIDGVFTIKPNLHNMEVNL
jgi:hypothetical protein